MRQQTPSMRPCCRSLAAALFLLASAAGAELRVEGVEDVIAENVQSYVAIASEPCDAPRWLVQRRFRNIVKEAKIALEPFGYYDPVIDTTLETDSECWQATVRIDPGQPVLLRNVNITLASLPADETNFSDLMASTRLAPGMPLRHSNYESLKEALQVRAAERGYAEAMFLQNTIDVWPSELAADVALNFQTGPRYAFGDITLEQSFLDNDLVSGFLDFEPGMPYDNRLLTTAYNDLSRSGYFSRIELLADIEKAGDMRIPVRVQLEPADRIEYTLGAGMSTDTGPQARAGYQNRRVNSRGHRFKADLSVSSLIQALAVEYRKPLADPRSEWLSYTAGVTNEDTDTSKSDTTRVGMRRSKRLSSNWMRTVAFDVTYDRYEIGGIESRSRLALPAVLYDHKRADRDIFPTRGRRLSLELRGTTELIGSDTSFLQAIASLRIVHSINADSRLLARTSIGVTAKSDFNELPPSVRFFAGGDESVRGFDFETLGPTDDAGNVIGGSNLLVASIEYEHRLRGNFFWAAFVDAGNAFDTFDVDPAAGTGLGIKWVSPLGPLRFYLAHPLNKSDRNVRVHIRLGPDL
ncbi:MAG: autotransporter assembly complex protein TamA [Gammaproteobacteria bacterium]|nr:autotransporter assembly complex protein TamA [Gammaproteobacteria bacterium]